MRKLITNVILFFLSLGLFQPLLAQTVTLEGDIYEYATYYVNSFDLNTGATNVQIFRYQLSAVSDDEYPIAVKISFRA